MNCYLKHSHIVIEQNIDSFKDSNATLAAGLDSLNVARKLVQMMFQLRQAPSKLNTLPLRENTCAQVGVTCWDKMESYSITDMG